MAYGPETGRGRCGVAGPWMEGSPRTGHQAGATGNTGGALCWASVSSPGRPRSKQRSRPWEEGARRVLWAGSSVEFLFPIRPLLCMYDVSPSEEHLSLPLTSSLESQTLSYRCVSASFSFYFLTDFASYTKSSAQYLGREHSWRAQPYLLCRRMLSGTFLLASKWPWDPCNDSGFCFCFV